MEDLHWADPSTLAVLGLLMDQVPTAKVMVLLSFRPEFTPPWPSRAYVTPIMLSRLTRRLAGEMVERLTGGKTLPEEVLSQVAAKSDGVPIFVEELTRMLLESNLLKEAGDHYELTGPLAPLAIPSTLQDSLTARLDRLSAAREVAQLGAILGREFTYELIKAVSRLVEELLGSHLQKLVNAEFLYQRGLPPEANYTFQHALIQDAAYESLLRSNRQQYHQRVAEAMEEGFTDAVETQPELLAHHFTEAGLTQRAVNYWLRAGQRALVIYAYQEALAYFEKGLAARDIALSGTETAPDEEAADLLFGLAQAQSATFQRDQIVEAFAVLKRSYEYYAEVGNVEQAVAAAEFRIIAPTYTIPGNAELLARALALVPSDSHEAARLLSRYGAILGATEGDYQGAQQALARAIAIARRDEDIPLEARTLEYATVLSFMYLNWQESVDHGLRAIELATDDANLYAAQDPQFWTAQSLLRMGDPDSARPLASAIRKLSERQIQLSRGQRGSSGFTPITYLSCLEGDWKASRDLTSQGLELQSRSIQLLSPRALLEYQTGETAQGDIYLERFIEAYRPPGPAHMVAASRLSLAIPTINRITGAPDRWELAEESADTVLSDPTIRPALAINAKAGLALLAVQRGDVPAAKEHYASLFGLEQHNTMIYTAVSVDRLLGLLSQTVGNIDQAAAHFEDALAFNRKAGYRPELAWTCCDFADALRDRGGSGDRAKAMDLLDECLAISSELGMRPLLERVATRQQQG